MAVFINNIESAMIRQYCLFHVAATPAQSGKSSNAPTTNPKLKYDRTNHHSPPIMTTPFTPQRLVLDTNVCLDLFVFRDPRWAGLLQALQDGQAQAITRADCRMEYQLVLDYPHLKVDPLQKPALMTSFDALITCVEPPTAMDMIKLPLCSDRDDQKFLELALQVRADILITKDKALLKLAKKTARAGLFSIIAPQAWMLPATA
jgi:putative PIN family toxin of toxin-antitoxin system